MYQYTAEETWIDWNWTERYPSRKELERYLSHACKKLDIERDVVFNTWVTKAKWEETDQRWYIYSGHRLLAVAQYLLPCVGDATKKYIPDIKGLSTFPAAYHTSEWPADVSVDGKRVGVIGTAASGLQVIESTGPTAAHLTIFQRTPNMATPRRQEKMTPEVNAAEKLTYAKRYANRMTFTGHDTDFIPRDAESDTPAEREAVYEGLWAKGGEDFWFGNYRDMLTSPSANRLAYDFWRSKVLPRIENPAHAAILAPETPLHPFGTRRPSLEECYFETFNRDNVTLVNLLNDPILEVTPTGIVTSSGTHDLDILVLATGYDFVTGSLYDIDMRGRDNTSLPSKWSLEPCKSPTTGPLHNGGGGGGGVKAHLGLATSLFPNLFFPVGPQAPTCLGLTPLLAELQTSHLTPLLGHARARGGWTVEASRHAEDRWAAECAEVVGATLFGAAVGTWYMGANIPGRRREAICWFGGVGAYVARLRECEERGFEGWVVCGRDGGAVVAGFGDGVGNGNGNGC